jgi:hypothetical protein
MMKDIGRFPQEIYAAWQYNVSLMQNLTEFFSAYLKRCEININGSSKKFTFFILSQTICMLSLEK